jgi:hypothetical protein
MLFLEDRLSSRCLLKHAVSGREFQFGSWSRPAVWGEQKLLEAYPSLRAEDLVNAWAYARSHVSEIETQIQIDEAA